MFKVQFGNESVSLIYPDYAVIKCQIEYMLANAQEYYETILDYGAGNSPYKKCFKSQKYITLDIEQNNDNSIDIIIDREHPVIPFEDESMDCILCMDVLEHIRDEEDKFKLFYNLLKKDGTIFISLPFMYREHMYPYDYRRYTSSGISYLLDKAGFCDIKLYKIGNPFFVAWNMIYERNIKQHETDQTCYFERIYNKIFNRTILPILNCTLFKIKCKESDSVFSRMLIVAHKHRE